MQIFDMDGQPLGCRDFIVFKAFRENDILYQELLGMYFSSSVLQVSTENIGILENSAVFKNDLLRNLRVKVPYVIDLYINHLETC
jgi:hypothetical protein